MVNTLAFQKLFLILPLITLQPQQHQQQQQQEIYQQIQPAVTIANSDWNYNQQGADWKNTCAYGAAQSPIALSLANSILHSQPPLSFINYDKPLGTDKPLKIVNNGHTVNLDVPPTRNGQYAYISGAFLLDKYQAVNVHFHWGSENSGGSEHVIDGRRYDVEMHIVHKNVKYTTTEEAMNNSDGIAVMAILFELTNQPKYIYPGLNKIFNKLHAVVEYQANAEIDGSITLAQLLGNLNAQEFFTYKGSLTTPNCNEVVIWFVFPNALSILYEQIAKFWDIKEKIKAPLNKNFRELQALNDRRVFYRIPEKFGTINWLQI